MVDATARLTTLTRLGFATRGLLYGVVAFLVLSAGQAEDLSGALGFVGRGGGQLLLMLMTAGLTAYGIWRLSDAAFDIGRHGADGKGIRERVGAGISGMTHLFLAWRALKLAQGTSAASGSGSQDYASKALALPGGEGFLIAAGLSMVGLGILQLMKAAKGTFLDHLEPDVAHKPWARWTGRSGYAARGVVFAVIGLFLARAGWAENASEAGGMAEALAWLSRPWDILVAAGLLGFGLFSLIETRYRV